MEVVIEVCDICGKKHGLMVKREEVVFGDRRCFLDFCNSIWLRWEREEFELRGVLAKKEQHPMNQELEEIEQQIVHDSTLLFKAKQFVGGRK